MRHLLAKLRGRSGRDAKRQDPRQEPSIDLEIEHFRAQQRHVAAKLMNGQRVYDDLERAARALHDEVCQPRPATPPHKA